MALQKNFELPPGFNVAKLENLPNVDVLIKNTPFLILNGYIKVCSVNGDKNLINFDVQYKLNRDSETLLTRGYSFKPSCESGAPNFIRQAYMYMKHLDEYTGAIDIMEEGQY
ncbi:hypothetical protein [Bacillus luti]|uniref:hypothetical protein n=1 Tax=Bacillus luti TaxID=2026191 RepID=UPI002897FB7B|nr:hypothetical protein [Bacillus luti]